MATKNCTLVDPTKCQCCTLQGKQCSRSPKHGKFCTQHSNKCNTVGTSKQVKQKPITLRLRQVGQVKQVKQTPISSPHKQNKQVKQTPISLPHKQSKQVKQTPIYLPHKQSKQVKQTPISLPHKQSKQVKQVKQKPNILSDETPDLVIKNICEQMKNTKNYRTLATTIQLSKRHKKLCQEYLDHVVTDKVNEIKGLRVKMISFDYEDNEERSEDVLLMKTTNQTTVKYMAQDERIIIHFRELMEPEMIDDLMKKTSRVLIVKNIYPHVISLVEPNPYEDDDYNNKYNFDAYQKWRGHVSNLPDPPQNLSDAEKLLPIIDKIDDLDEQVADISSEEDSYDLDQEPETEIEIPEKLYDPYFGISVIWTRVIQPDKDYLVGPNEYYYGERYGIIRSDEYKRVHGVDFQKNKHIRVNSDGHLITVYDVPYNENHLLKYPVLEIQ
jgi:hypothetical protein